MRIFISYASEDRLLAEEIYLALVQAGHKVSYDRESLRAGDDFRARLEEQVKGSDAFVFLATSDSIADGSFALTEMEHAKEKWPYPGRHLVTVRCKGVEISRIPAWLRQVTLLDEAGTGNLPAEVVRAVRKLQPRRTRRVVLMSAGASALLLSLLAIVASANRDPVDRLLATTLDPAGVMWLAERPLRDAEQRLRARGRLIEFVAIVSRRPRTLGACDRGVADSLAGREDVRRAMDFVRRTSMGAPSDSTPSGGGPRSLLRSVQRALRGRAAVPVVSLDSTNLSGFRLDQADLRGLSFVDACLHGTVFSDASLQGSRFNGAQADSAVFTRARLDSSQFASAALVGAVFFGACLRHADFSGANLTYARFVQSDVSWVNFFGATLEGAEGWSETDSNRTNALYLDVKGLTPTDSGAIVAAGGILDGTDFPAWEERRKAARPVASTVAACQPETQSSN